MPASGKTTLGKTFAAAYGFRFYDLDALVVATNEQSIGDMVREKGESYFREKEREALLELISELKEEKNIIACGGGTPCFFDNLEQMKSAGTIVFIDISVKTLARRLKKEKLQERPLLQKPRLKRRLSHVLRKRIPYYIAADFRLKGLSATPANLLAALHYERG